MIPENSGKVRKASILSICDDENLQFTRELVLRSEGYTVVSRRSEDIQPGQNLGRFDLAILCRTVSRKRAFEIAALLRKISPQIRLLRIDSLEAQSDDGHALRYGLVNSPDALLGVVKSLCERQSELH